MKGSSEVLIGLNGEKLKDLRWEREQDPPLEVSLTRGRKYGFTFMGYTLDRTPIRNCHYTSGIGYRLGRYDLV